MERNEEHAAADRQISGLADRMRTEGVPPGRDLWPGIDRAITAAERQHFAIPRPAGARDRFRPLAVAATLAVLLISGGVMVRQYDTGTGPAPAPVRLVERDRGVAAADGLEVIDRALAELSSALDRDPENRNLSHLALMMHKKRGNLLRRDIASRNM
jgi:hypothetical protein